MNVETFFAHYGIRDNPFAAEEARLDPVFDKLLGEGPMHPDFPKVLGRIDKPSTAVVFGEKGSGKTAIRLMLDKQIEQHNREQPRGDKQTQPGRRVLLVSYDELNPFLDNLLRSTTQDVDKALARIRLADHQDAILSLAVTRMVDSLLGDLGPDEKALALPTDLDRRIRTMPRRTRADLAVLAGLYDQPRTGVSEDRFDRLRRKLHLRWRLPLNLFRDAGGVLLLTALVLGGLWRYVDQPPWWASVGCVVAAILAAGSLGWWLTRLWKLWRMSRSAVADMPLIGRSSSELRHLLADLRGADLARQPMPTKHHGAEPASDSRYQLTRRLLDALSSFGYVGLIVLVDRVDEPTSVQGQAERMRAVVWPMLDNKFLQQDRLGLKLLLPLELRHMLMRESPAFFQEARLDKQNLIDRLTWSGATLYDLCSRRLSACREEGKEPITLGDLFEQDVSREMLVDALDQMHQPRDAFKLVYAVIQEHCRLATEEEAKYRIARLTLESVRRTQAQRVQELYRGLSPA